MVAEAGGEILGFLMAQLNLGEFGSAQLVATIDTISVHPEVQGQGIATELMGQFIEHAREIGVERIRTIVDWEQ